MQPHLQPHAHDLCPTVRVRAANGHGSALINESDFDPAMHELHVEPGHEKPAAVVKAKR